MSLEQRFIELDKTRHDVKGFNCGKTTMNDFLSRYATKHSKLGLSRTYVLTEVPDNQIKQCIAAYYTLSASSVVQADLPVTQSLPRHPIPVVMLGRLAVDMRYQGRGLGAKSLVYALRQASQLSAQGLPAYGLILDALDEDALAFYQNFDFFQPFTDNPMRLFASMKTLCHL